MNVNDKNTIANTKQRNIDDLKNELLIIEISYNN